MSVESESGRPVVVTSKAPGRRRRLAANGMTALKLLVSLLFLWLVLSGVDRQEVARIAHRADAASVAFAVALLAAVPAISAPRWRGILRHLGHPISFRLLLRALYIGSFLSQILPSSLGGDAWRIWFCSRLQVPLTAAFNSVILERLAGLAATVLCLSVTFPILLSKIDEHGARLGIWAIFLASIGGVIGLPLLGRIADRLPPWLIPSPFAAFLKSFSLVWRSRRLAALMLLSALLGQLTAVTSLFSLSTALNVPLSLFDCFVILPPALLVALVPVSLGGWGLREGAFVVILRFYNVPSEQALALSVMFGLALLVSTLPGLALWCISSTSKLLRKDGATGGATG